MFVKGTSLKKRILGCLVLTLMAGLIGMALWGMATGNEFLTSVAALPFLLAVLWGMVYSGRRAKRDPEFAQRVSQARDRARKQQSSNARAGLIAAVMALVVVIGAVLMRAYLPGFAQLPKGEQRFYLFAGGLPAVVLMNLLWWKLRRKKPAA